WVCCWIWWLCFVLCCVFLFWWLGWCGVVVGGGWGVWVFWCFGGVGCCFGGLWGGFGGVVGCGVFGLVGGLFVFGVLVLWLWFGLDLFWSCCVGLMLV
ncbi:hypothetical protein, partial [Pseudomonas syringae group genomosp. 7]|uniref:hypothetical protein n=1 Tax=Pseudomonas syringae group genomosp. 7 TaxID=251699 RepID=UPI00376FBA52